MKVGLAAISGMAQAYRLHSPQNWFLEARATLVGTSVAGFVKAGVTREGEMCNGPWIFYSLVNDHPALGCRAAAADLSLLVGR